MISSEGMLPVSIWREEFLSVIKTKAEREVEEAERRRLRIEAALQVAREAMALALEGLGFAKEQLGVRFLLLGLLSSMLLFKVFWSRTVGPFGTGF